MFSKYNFYLIFASAFFTWIPSFTLSMLCTSKTNSHLCPGAPYIQNYRNMLVSHYALACEAFMQVSAGGGHVIKSGSFIPSINILWNVASYLFTSCLLPSHGNPEPGQQEAEGQVRGKVSFRLFYFKCWAAQSYTGLDCWPMQQWKTHPL